MDIVIENGTGDIFGIEVKTSAIVTSSDLAGLRKLAGACKFCFRCGPALHDGNEAYLFGTNMYAAPVASLWAGQMT